MIHITPEGEKKLRAFIEECKAKRKEILDAGIDTADETNLPTYDDIISDMEWDYGTYDESNDYCNCWGVTDNYNSDLPLFMQFNMDFIVLEEKI